MDLDNQDYLNLLRKFLSKYKFKKYQLDISKLQKNIADIKDLLELAIKENDKQVMSECEKNLNLTRARLLNSREGRNRSSGACLNKIYFKYFKNK